MSLPLPEYAELPEDRARQFLAFERAHPNPAGTDDAIRRELGLTPARYHQHIARLIDTQQALDIDPQTTHRLRRIRDERQAEINRRSGHH